MIEKVLNRIGLYTQRQYFAAINRNVHLQKMNERLISSLNASEDAKSLIVEENEKLKLKLAKAVKRRKK